MLVMLVWWLLYLFDFGFACLMVLRLFAVVCLYCCLLCCWIWLRVKVLFDVVNMFGCLIVCWIGWVFDLGGIVVLGFVC